MQRIEANKVSALFIKEKAIEKLKDKAKKVFHKIFLGLSTRFMQYGSIMASYPLN